MNDNAADSYGYGAQLKRKKPLLGDVLSEREGGGFYIIIGLRDKIAVVLFVFTIKDSNSSCMFHKGDNSNLLFFPLENGELKAEMNWVGNILTAAAMTKKTYETESKIIIGEQ